MIYCLVSPVHRALWTSLVVLLPVPHKLWTVLLSFGCSLIASENVRKCPADTVAEEEHGSLFLWVLVISKTLLEEIENP